ncbi:MAG: alpha-ribazole phosphatase [Rhodoferax sp.]|jgi:alpha-ribazole phosphatase
MKLWLVRHAQPLIAAGICYGATDMAADVTATQQAAQALALALPPSLRLVSSPLQRCLQLTQALCVLRPDLTNTQDARLAEMNFGCWEGQRWDSIPKTDIDRWTADFGRHRFGGRMSVHEFMAGVTPAWDEARQAGQEQVWITHAGVIRAVTLLSQGVRQVDQAAQWPQQAPAFGCWHVLPV